MRPLIPVEIGPHFLDAPLPHDLYNRQGVLVARAGSVISAATRLDQLAELRLFRPHQFAEPAQVPALEILHQIGQQYARLLASPPDIDPEGIATLASALRQLAAAHPEVCIGMAQRLPLASLSQRHALYVAAVAIVVGRGLNLGEAGELALACAALTMNLSAQPLQDQLAASPGRPDAWQREALRRHPLDAADLLARAGVADAAWLTAVRQHHENMDGSGYPLGLRGDEIGPEARILRAADVWCALLSQRHTRIARYPDQALAVAYRRERGRLDDAAMLVLRRLLGRYPPGTLVRLANRETAVVTRWFGDQAQPKFAISLLRPSGTPIPRPQVRNTTQVYHAIRAYTYLPLVHAPLAWERAWSLR